MYCRLSKYEYFSLSPSSANFLANFLNWTLSLNHFSNNVGIRPFLSCVYNTPLEDMDTLLSFKKFWNSPVVSLALSLPFLSLIVYVLSTPLRNGSTSQLSNLPNLVSGDIFKLIIIDGYILVISKSYTHSCLPFCGSWTYAPANLSLPPIKSLFALTLFGATIPTFLRYTRIAPSRNLDE